MFVSSFCWPCNFSWASVRRVTGSRSAAISAEMIELVSSPEASPEMEIGEPAAELTASDDMGLVVHPVNSLWVCRLYARDLTVHGVRARTGSTCADTGDRQTRGDAGKHQWIYGMDH
jgi:hypothetical protein